MTKKLRLVLGEEPQEVDLTPEEETEFAAKTPPPPTTEQLRVQEFESETDLADLLDRLRNATPQQINNWIDTNVTSIASARTVLKMIIKCLVALSYQGERL